MYISKWKFQLDQNEGFKTAVMTDKISTVVYKNQNQKQQAMMLCLTYKIQSTSKFYFALTQPIRTISKL